MESQRRFVVHGRGEVAPFRTVDQLLVALFELIALAEREGSGSELRNRRLVVDARLAATREGLALVDALRGWELDDVAAWFLWVALAYELLPDREPPTVASCAHIAAAITEAPAFASLGAVHALVRQDLVALAGGEAPFHAQRVRALPRVVELAVSA